MAKLLRDVIAEDETVREEYLKLQKKHAKEQFDQVVAFAKEHGIESDEEELKKELFSYWESGKLHEAIIEQAEAKAI